jgi:hypothetical protein
MAQINMLTNFTKLIQKPECNSFYNYGSMEPFLTEINVHLYIPKW